MKNIPSLDNFSPEQLEKMKGMQNLDEVLEFAAKEGVDLTDEQLEAISGGTDSEYQFDAAQALATI